MFGLYKDLAAAKSVLSLGQVMDKMAGLSAREGPLAMLDSEGEWSRKSHAMSPA